MKKYFVCSDIHGFYDEFIASLNEANFDINNDEHILIVLGDIFDRGKKPWEVYKFLRSIPEHRLVMIMGNHELLLLELVNKKYPDTYDYHNGTFGTLVSLSKDPYEVQMEWLKKHKDEYSDYQKLIVDSHIVYDNAKKEIYDNEKLNEIIDWIKSDKWQYFYELDKYIFIHSFIPLQIIDPIFDTVRYNPDWRNSSSEQEFQKSTWGCPYKLFQAGLFDEEIKKGKILVCGHWHTSDFFNNLIYPNQKDKWFDIKINNPIFKTKEYPNLIALDACTTLTKKVNVLVLDV